jgi:hypothetical protein
LERRKSDSASVIALGRTGRSAPQRRAQASRATSGSGIASQGTSNSARLDGRIEHRHDRNRLLSPIPLEFARGGPYPGAPPACFFSLPQAFSLVC